MILFSSKIDSKSAKNVVISLLKEKIRNFSVKVMDAKVKKSSSALKTLSEKCQLTRFTDYFVICGLDIENGLEADLYTGAINCVAGSFVFVSTLLS